MSTSMLKTESISKHFYGLKALDQVSIDVQKGQIYGIIGPNGAGKTTLFNSISGFYAPTSGEIYFEGKNMTGKNITEFAVEGMARTFQNIRVFGEMTVLENVMVGMHKNIKTDLAGIFLHTKKQKKLEEDARQEAMELLEYLGIQNVANEYAGSLPYGTQRLVEIGRAIASKPKLLLLDEPSAGMNDQETMDLMYLIKKIRDEKGPTVIVIEHNMQFIMGMCDRITVLNFGQHLMTGSPTEIQTNDQVIQAYLGEE